MLFFFLYLFLNRYLPENYPKTLRKQIEQKVCMYTPSVQRDRLYHVRVELQCRIQTMS